MRHLDELCALRVIGPVSLICRGRRLFARSRLHRMPTKTLHMLGLHVAAASMDI